MNETIVMIHGMWCGSWCWDNYKAYFESKGYRCHTPVLRYHDMNPGSDPDPRLGTVSLIDYADDLEKCLNTLDTLPIIIGHSMGGLLAQILASRKLAKAIVLLTPAAPHGILSLTPSVVKSFWSLMTTWGFWRKPGRQTFKEAAYSTMGVLPLEKKMELKNKFVYESGKASFEIGFWYLDPSEASKVNESDIACPMLIVAGTEDKLTPAPVVRKIAHKYKEVAVYKEFNNHGHWLHGEPGWENIAEFSSQWLQTVIEAKKLDPAADIEQRKYLRIPYRAPIALSGPELPLNQHGRVQNCSMEGIQFKSDIAIQPGSNISVKLVDESSGIAGPMGNDDRSAEVKWYQQHSDTPHYNIGAQFADTHA